MLVRKNGIVWVNSVKEMRELNGRLFDYIIVSCMIKLLRSYKQRKANVNEQKRLNVKKVVRPKSAYKV